MPVKGLSSVNALPVINAIWAASGISLVAIYVGAPHVEIETLLFPIAYALPTITLIPSCYSSEGTPIKIITGRLYIDAVRGPDLKGGYLVGHGSGGSWTGEERKADNSADDGRAGEHVGGCFGTQLATKTASDTLASYKFELRETLLKKNR